MNTQNKLRSHQQGVALVMFAIGMLVIVGIAGMALDLSHLMLDDTRLQNAMDACALSGAQVLMETDDTDDARTKAKATFAKNLGGLGNVSDPVVHFSDTLENFTLGGLSPRYVRCEVENYSIVTTLAKVFKIQTLELSVTAVAGPITIDKCNVVPLLVCGDCGENGICDKEEDCPAGGTECYGFNVFKDDDSFVEEKCYLKACPPGSNCQDLETGQNCGTQVAGGAPDGGGSWAADVSAGNFDLLDMTCISGKKGTPCIKESFTEGGAQIAGGCPFEGNLVTTKPGNTASVIDAFNTLFDGPNPDTVPDSPLLYSEYIDGYPDDGNRRRELGVVIGDCTSPIIKPGKTDVPVLTVGCFFATDKGIKGGGTQVIWGEFIGDCPGTGNLDKDPDAFDTYKIVLYKDHLGPDS